MRHAVVASGLVVAVFLLMSALGSAQGRPLDLREALGLARERAARILAATGEVEAARARLLPVERRLRENPVVELSGGRRQADETFTDYEIALSQGFEPAGRRAARLAVARAALDVAQAGLDDVRRVYLGEVTAAFVRAVAAGERLRLASAAAKLTGDLLTTLERRYDMGETTALELNRARTAAARSRAERLAAEGERVGAGGELAALLGLEPLEPETIPEPRGELRELPVYALEALLARAGERSDQRALAAGVRAAEAEIWLGETLARPDFGLQASYQREEGTDVITAGLVVALPVSRRGEEERAVARSRAASLAAQRPLVRRGAELEVRSAYDAYRHRVAAVEELERTALPAVADNETLARRSFEVGEINLGELLLVQREILETRLAHLELMLQARLAAVALETSAGVER